MTPASNEIEDLRAACKIALDAYLKAISDSDRAHEQLMRLGAPQDGEAYVTATENEAKCHAELVALRDRLRLASMGQK